MCWVYDEKLISRQTVEKWYDLFKNDRTDVTDEWEDRSRQKQLKILCAHERNYFFTIRRITVNEIAEALTISFGSAQQVITKHIEHRERYHSGEEVKNAKKYD